jgi:probable F420-dependent oxidoreductase
MASFYCAGGGPANRGTIPAVKFGLLPPYRSGVTADPQWMTAFARAAEASGFESLYVAEHVVVPAGYTSRYPYSDTGRMTLPDNADFPDPLDLLAFVAGVTTTLGLGTGLLVLPEHHPVQLAKRLATLDRLSGGRLVVGVGVGWLREELEAMDIDPSTRGARADECIEAMRVLWRDDEATFHGRFFDFERACSFPKPLDRTIPIHIGGHSETAARRAGRVGDGFHPLGLEGEQLEERLDQMRAAAAEAGRDANAIEITLGGLLDQLDDARLATVDKHGTTRLVLSTRERDIGKATDQLEHFANRFIR